MEESIVKMEEEQKVLDLMIQELAKESLIKSINNVIKMHEPIFDGPRDFKKYLDCSKKIMFILKEPNAPDGADWNYRTSILNNDNYFGSMNNVAKGILYGNTESDPDEKLSLDAPIHETVFINISNLPGLGSVGLHGTMKELYLFNKKVLEKRFIVYDPDIIIVGGTEGENWLCDIIWESIEKSYGGFKKDRNIKFFDLNGEEICSGEKAGTQVYYYKTNNGREIISICAYHPSIIGKNITNKGKLTKDGWVNGIVKACR